MIRIAILICILPAFGLRAQWQEITLEEFSEALLAMEAKIPEGESYSYDATYLFFEEPASMDTSLVYDFELVNQIKKGHFYMRQFGREVIQNAQVQLVCDTTEKQLILQEPSPEYYKRKTTADFAMLLQSKCKARKKTVGKQTVYYLEFAPGARFKGAELYLNSDGNVTTYILYTAMDVLDDTGETNRFIHPRMEVHFSHQQTGKVVDDKVLKNVDDYFLDFTNKVLKEEYKAYELIDLRNELK